MSLVNPFQDLTILSQKTGQQLEEIYDTKICQAVLQISPEVVFDTMNMKLYESHYYFLAQSTASQVFL